jgi:hypothetical protein
VELGPAATRPAPQVLQGLGVASAVYFTPAHRLFHAPPRSRCLRLIAASISASGGLSTGSRFCAFQLAPPISGLVPEPLQEHIRVDKALDVVMSPDFGQTAGMSPPAHGTTDDILAFFRCAITWTSPLRRDRPIAPCAQSDGSTIHDPNSDSILRQL